MYWFGSSSGVVNFDFSHMMPTLTSGSLYVQPGSNKTVVSFSRWQGVTASVEGSRMIVQVVPEGIWVYCFEGSCQLDPGGESDIFTIPVGYKRFYSPEQGVANASAQMTNDEMWAWSQRCNACLYGTDIILAPTPTLNSAYNPTPTAFRNEDNGSGNLKAPPTPTEPPPYDPPTSEPPWPTAPPPTPAPPQPPMPND